MEQKRAMNWIDSSSSTVSMVVDELSILILKTYIVFVCMMMNEGDADFQTNLKVSKWREKILLFKDM